jgi:hypothetical protein
LEPAASAPAFSQGTSRTVMQDAAPLDLWSAEVDAALTRRS